MQAGHKYLNAADVSTACAVPRRLFVKFQRQMSRLASQLIPSKTPVLRASPDLSANLLQSKVSYGRHTSFSRASLQPGEGNRRRGGYPALRQITPAMQDHYYAASPFNLVRIILGRREPSDNTTDNVYTRAAAFGREWREKTIFRQDSSPSIYTYSQTFTAPSGKKFERRGFIALGRVEDYSAKVVFRHEQTLAKPKADRLDLLRATRTHYEQLFLLYEDSGEIDFLLASKELPVIDVEDEYGVAHRVWQIADPSVVGAVQEKMGAQKLVIADGHHRYETALNFRNECRAASGQSNGDAPYEFVMMTFVNLNDPGMVILPTHRVVHSLNSFSVDEFQRGSAEYFEVE